MTNLVDNILVLMMPFISLSGAFSWDKAFVLYEQGFRIINVMHNPLFSSTLRILSRSNCTNNGFDRMKPDTLCIKSSCHFSLSF